MVKWIADNTKRFRERPHFEAREIDAECEQLVVRFLKKSYGQVEYPISTDDLSKLIETKADLDIYADLSGDGEDVEGVTRFEAANRPFVEISESLSGSERRENRFRTTLAHEFGHVHFHDSIVQMKLSSGDLFSAPKTEKVVCKRDRMIDAPFVDWMEWQACYASGAFLMPKSALAELVDSFRRSKSLYSTVCDNSSHGSNLIDEVKARFGVSSDAARIRLIKLRFLASGPTTKTLFD